MKYALLIQICVQCPPRRPPFPSSFLRSAIVYFLSQIWGFLVLRYVSILPSALGSSNSCAKGTYGENSPSLWPTMSSVIVTWW